MEAEEPATTVDAATDDFFRNSLRETFSSDIDEFSYAGSPADLRPYRDISEWSVPLHPEFFRASELHGLDGHKVLTLGQSHARQAPA